MTSLQLLSLPLLGALAWIDHRQQRVPNLVVLPAVIVALTALLLIGDVWLVVEHVSCALLLGLAFCLMALRGGGMGDAKLVTLLGLVWGHLSLWMVALAGILATVSTVVLAVIRRQPISRGMSFPFVPYLFAGTVAILMTEIAR